MTCPQCVNATGVERQGDDALECRRCGDSGALGDLRVCKSCDTEYRHTDEPCRGERSDPPWCDGRHNCAVCQFLMGLHLHAIAVRTGQTDFVLTRGTEAEAVWNAIPEDSPLMRELLDRASEERIERGWQQAMARARRAGLVT